MLKFYQKTGLNTDLWKKYVYYTVNLYSNEMTIKMREKPVAI